jgi:hypothetical protein
MTSSINFINIFLYGCGFYFLYILSAYILLHFPSLGFNSSHFNTKQNRTRCYSAASRIIGIIHASVLTYGGLMELINLYYNNNGLDYLRLNSNLEIALIEWSFSYFIIDLVHFWLHEREDLFLLIHHLISIGFFVSILYCNRGGVSYLVAAIGGEITNPVQSLWYLSKQGGYQRTYQFLSPVFTLLFVLFRVVLVPLIIYDLGHNYYKQIIIEHNKIELNPIFPLTWFSMSVLMGLGGIVWSIQLVKGLIKFYTKKKQDPKTE